MISAAAQANLHFLLNFVETESTAVQRAKRFGASVL